MKCTVCGCENEENVTLCAQCGLNLLPAAEPVETVTCVHCGKQLRPSAKYCVYCGEKQIASAPTEAPADEAIEESSEAAVAACACDAEPAARTEESALEESYCPAAEKVEYHIPATGAAPAYQHPTHRGFWKMLLLGIITGMIYPLVVMSRISVEINMVASRRDGKRTTHFLWMPILGALTLGVYCFVWFHKLCNRIGNELQRRSIPYKFSASSFWLWNFLYGIIGSSICSALYVILIHIGVPAQIAILCAGAAAIVSSIGPCIFIGKLMRAMNLVNADYNEKG